MLTFGPTPSFTFPPRVHSYQIKAECSTARFVAQDNSVKILNHLARVEEPHSIVGNLIVSHVGGCLIAFDPVCQAMNSWGSCRW